MAGAPTTTPPGGKLIVVMFNILKRLPKQPQKPPQKLPLPPPQPPPKLQKPQVTGQLWTQQPVDGEFARALRRGIRARRREKGRMGHRFRYDDARAMYSFERRDEIHTVVTHHEDRLWQYWRCDPDNGWTLESWHKTEGEAKAAAEQAKPKPRPKPAPKPEPGTYLHATWAHEKYHGTRPMTVKCSTPYTAEILTTIFQHLGCAVETKEVAA